jgi:hypothetical protein
MKWVIAAYHCTVAKQIDLELSGVYDCTQL